MPLKLFDRGRRSLDSHLRRNEEVTALNGFGSAIFAGTNHGCLLVLAASSDSGHWEKEAKLQLSEESSRKSTVPITQIFCASALNLIIVLHGEQMFGIQLGQLSEELEIEKLLDKVKRISANSNSTTDDPFAVQLAIAHTQKPLIIVGLIVAELTGHFRKDHKVVTAGKVLEFAYSGNSLCYVVSCGGGGENKKSSIVYFVHNFQNKNNQPIRLFDATQQQQTSHVICAVGMEEFCLTGVHGLLMFVNGQGASTRPPISMPGEFPSVGLTLKEPFYYTLDSSGMLFVFCTMDGQLKQCLDFPSDEDESRSYQSNQITPKNYQLANVDGRIFVLPPAGHCFFELVSMEIFDQINDHIQLGHLDTALTMMEENFAQICTTSINSGGGEQTMLLQMRQFQAEIAFRFLQKGEFEKAFNLLTQSEADPCLLLSIVGKQQSQIDLNMDNGHALNLPIEVENFPEIPLTMVEKYLEGILRHSTDDVISQIEIQQSLESWLARICTLLGKFPPNEYLLVNGTWNSKEFREWLAKKMQQPGLAAKLASQIGDDELAEAFTRWREIAERNDGKLKSEILDDCLQALEKIKCAKLMESILPWLGQIQPKLWMEAIENLEANSPGEFVQPECVIKKFEAISPKLLFAYLDKRINTLSSPFCHNKMLDLYFYFLQNDDKEDLERKQWRRQKLRNFLVFSRHYDRQRAQHYFGEEKHKILYKIELIFSKADEECAVDCLRELTTTISNDEEGEELLRINDRALDREERMAAAEMLCTRYQSPEMLKTLLTVHLRLSGSNPHLQLQLPRLLSLFHNDVDANEVLQNVPATLSSTPLIQNFLCRHFANRLATREWQKMHAKLAEFEANKLNRELTKMRRTTYFRMDERSACSLCGRALGGKGSEEFARNPQNGQLIHLRCHKARREKV